MKRSYRTKNNKKAFTLIELLIVIAIIGILFIVLVSRVDFATDKAKATGVQTDFRSFQVALDQVAKENAGFNVFGWDTGDVNGDRIRNSYDKGDTNKNGKEDAGETFIGRKEYGETWTTVYTMLNPDTTKADDVSAFVALEQAINANLDPKLHITITPDVDGGVLTGDATITMANQARDPWKNEYHGVFITNADEDGQDRGAIIIYSDGANGEWGSAHDIANGVVSITIPGNNVAGQDDMSIVSCYTYVNGYGEVLNMTTGFSSNQNFLTSGGSNVGTNNNGGGNVSATPTASEGLEYNLKQDGTYEVISYGACMDNDVVIPSEVNGIPVTSIGWDAFRECDRLTSITIPDSVTDIYMGAFYYCTNLENMMFGTNSELKLIDIVAFAGCTSLTNIEFPNNLTTIEESAFSDCTNLTSIYIPDSVTNLVQHAFDGCRSLTSVTFGENSQLIHIQNHVFYGCRNITSITIPRSLKTIGEVAFSDCINLRNISFAGTVAQWNAINKSSSWHDAVPATYIQCSDGKVDMNGNTVPTYSEGLAYTLKGDGTYEVSGLGECTDLNIVIPSKVNGITVTSIGEYAFDALYHRAECANIVSIIIPETVTSIADYAFYGCSSLTNIVIPESVTNIGIVAFYRCTSLETIVLPGSLTYVSEALFYYCSNLRSVTFNGTTEKWISLEKYISWCGYTYDNSNNMYDNEY